MKREDEKMKQFLKKLKKDKKYQFYLKQFTKDVNKPVKTKSKKFKKTKSKKIKKTKSKKIKKIKKSKKSNKDGSNELLENPSISDAELLENPSISDAKLLLNLVNPYISYKSAFSRPAIKREISPFGPYFKKTKRRKIPIKIVYKNR
jgi:hypothetical protein